MERVEPAGRGWLTVDEGEVGLLHGPVLERALERLEGGVVLGDHETAGGLLVQAVDDAWPEHTTHAGEARDVVEERVHQRSSGVPGRGVDDEAGGLVENEEVTVLVEDTEREILCLGNGGLRRGDGDAQGLAAPQSKRCTSRLPVDLHPPCLDERLHAGTAQLGEARGDGAVEPLATQGRADGEPVRLPLRDVASRLGAQVARTSLVAWARPARAETWSWGSPGRSVPGALRELRR